MSSLEQPYLDYIVVSASRQAGHYQIAPHVPPGVIIPLLEPPLVLSEFRGSPADFEQKAIAAFNANPVYPKNGKLWVGDVLIHTKP